MHSDRDALWKRLPDCPDGTRAVRLCLAGSTLDTVEHIEHLDTVDNIEHRYMSHMRTPLVRVTGFLHKTRMPVD